MCSKERPDGLVYQIVYYQFKKMYSDAEIQNFGE